MIIENRIKDLGLELPPSSPPGALYIPVKRSGNNLYVSGQVPMKNGIPIYTGKIGNQRNLEYGKEAAKLCVLNMLAALKDYVGNLDLITNVVKLQVFVNSEVGFTEQHIVANAASQLLHDIFGEKGHHARTAVGTNQLPMDFTVEIEGIFQVGGDCLDEI